MGLSPLNPNPAIRPVIVVRRVALQLVFVVGILLVAAILDVGPRATAAYRSMADVSGAGLDVPTDQGTDLPSKRLLGQDQDGLPPIGLHLQGGGGMSAPNSGSASGSAPVFAALTVTELPTSGLVAYFREPPISIHLSAFIDSLLDPPRQA
jgi:hypothetical protein